MFSISAWQFRHSNVHLFISSMSFCGIGDQPFLRELPMFSSLSSGFVW